MIGRRGFLGGAAAMLSLPWLESLASDAHAGPAAGADRLICFYVPNGMPMNHLTPSRVGRDFDLPAVLEPLASIREHVSVISGLRNEPANLDTAGHHAAGTAGFLTARRAARSESRVEVGVSLDQEVARELGRTTLLDSLALGIEGGDGIGDCDNGFSCAYSRNISWSSPSTPRPKLTDPQIVFETMFGGYDPEASASERSARRAQRRSVLDVVHRQARDLSKTVSASDRARLDGYLESIREVERRVSDARSPRCPVAETFDLGSALGASGALDFETHVGLMVELMVLALECDVTRVVTFMLGNSASNRDFSFLGVSEGHHDLSHHAGDPRKLQALVDVSRWEVAVFARLVDALRAVPEGSGTVLDRTIVLFSSELSDGDRHTHDDLPVVVAGGGGRAFSTGHHHHYPDVPIANLFLGILHSLGLPHERFGEDGEAPLPCFLGP